MAYRIMTGREVWETYVREGSPLGDVVGYHPGVEAGLSLLETQGWSVVSTSFGGDDNAHIRTVLLHKPL